MKKKREVEEEEVLEEDFIEEEEEDYLLADDAEEKLNELMSMLPVKEVEYPTETHLLCRVKANTDPAIKEIAPPFNTTLLVRERIV